MGPLLSWMGALWLTQATPVACWSHEDPTPGWKRVELPASAPQLAAPVDVDQFRSGEPVLVREANVGTYFGGQHVGTGRMAFRFQVQPGTTRLELDFLGSLRGAKVDATAYVGPRPLHLLDERRIPGSSLMLEWGSEEVGAVVVEVHYHLRERPVVQSWWATRRVWPERDAALPGEFKAARSLYFFHPGGGRVLSLCQQPDLTPRTSRWPQLGLRLVTVALKPTP
ncbi:hypothetical protein HUA78_16785 [Myxococcus sp. CA033]|uniref:hypothetical protein n=1 Tax=Myxococcus sp. CA033 TaxID=2741516 RepID=UPI00157AD777|nr:hypothetical protein [Myxococcus sp. CA033]NTX36106.1 hypothetical protein [Myxococcus sp. CA033]